MSAAHSAVHLALRRRRRNEHRHRQRERDCHLDLVFRRRRLGDFAQDHPVRELAGGVRRLEPRKPHDLATFPGQLDDRRRENEVLGEHHLVAAVGLLGPGVKVRLQHHRRVTFIGDRHGHGTVLRLHVNPDRCHREGRRESAMRGSED